MKINAIVQLCKAAKRILLFYDADRDVQWIGDGNAYYPLYSVPLLEEDSVFVFFDIPNKKREKVNLEYKEGLPTGVDFADRTEDEHPVEMAAMSVCAHGRVLLPVRTSFGCIYINEKYLKPFSDCEKGVQLYERHTASGAVYIVAKEGLLLKGVILPYYNITESFVEELKELWEHSRIGLENSECEIDQMEIEDT